MSLNIPGCKAFIHAAQCVNVGEGEGEQELKEGKKYAM